MRITEFRFLRTSDTYDTRYNVWSRAYEYPAVLNEIQKSYPSSKPLIHNSSCGFEGVHIQFRDELDKLAECVHSDIVKSEFRENYYYDICEPKPDFSEKFDVVLNISTIEHIKPRKLQPVVIRNLYAQVKPSGLLILTFDYPRVNLAMIEKSLGARCQRKPKDRLRGSNSVFPAAKWRHRRLSVVYLVIQKDSTEALQT